MAALKHSVKRRKLSPSQLSPDTTPHTTPKIITASNLQKHNVQNPTCVSCHRSLNATQGYLILCSRCSTPTCVVCSRTCNASVPSTPPTPLLVWSSTSPSPTLPSPRRVALALTSANTNLGGTASAAHHSVTAGGASPSPSLVGKRRKFTADDLDNERPKAQENNNSYNLNLVTQTNHGIGVHGNGNSNGIGNVRVVRDGDEDQVLPGCGRVICRNCCFENSQNNTITCYDCYGQ